MKILESMGSFQKSKDNEDSGKKTLAKAEKLKEKYDISESDLETDSQDTENDDEEEEEDVDFDLLLESGRSISRSVQQTSWFTLKTKDTSLSGCAPATPEFLSDIPVLQETAI